MTKKRFQLDPETIKLIQVIESTEDEQERRRAIDNLADQGGMNAARVLIETFERTMWRETKIVIIQALARVSHERSLEFLCRLASSQEDYGLASEAILALGVAEHPVAGEFLASIVRSPNHPLVREALTSLANLNFFPCEDELAPFLEGNESEVPLAIMQNVIIAAGLRGYRRFLKPITKLIESRQAGALFNTAIMAVGRIGDSSSLALLESLDTRYRSFAHQLKMSAVDHLRLTATYSIEDAVQSILSAETPVASRQAWTMLGAFDQASVKEALNVFADESDFAINVLQRAHLYESGRLIEDFKFLADHDEKLHQNLFARLGRLHVRSHPAKTIIETLRKIGDKFFIRFTAYVRIERAWMTLTEIVEDINAPLENRQNALNSITSQHLMHGLNQELRDHIGKRLVKSMDAVDSDLLRSRIIRALGQLRYSGPDALNALRENLRSGHCIEASYSALALCDSDDAVRIIVKRLRQILTSPDALQEVRMAIHSLARSERACDASCLSQISPEVLTEMQIPVLKILTKSAVNELVEFVAEQIRTGDFQTKLLAIAAAKIHQSEAISDCLFEYLDHPSQAVGVRSLDTLVTSFGSQEQLRVFKKIQQRTDDDSFIRKVFRSLAPRTEDSYKDVVLVLDQLIQERKGALRDQELFQAAVNLRDNLVSINALDSNDSVSIKLAARDELDKHAIDDYLGKELRGFNKYSSTIKSVLRSGEVTWQHPELFDARVDKSTVLVQYVKAVDLLLQEKIGSQMFLGQGAQFLQKMQSRVIRLELDEDSGWDNHLVSSLDCSMYFSRDSFPAHKLMSICRSIMTGQIMKEQYKVVDGLRAWAVLLLLFGRVFKFRGQSMESLYPMMKSTNDGVCRIAQAMNDLQDARNRAAHRGTVLEKENIKELRFLSTRLLNDLDDQLVIG